MKKDSRTDTKLMNSTVKVNWMNYVLNCARKARLFFRAFRELPNNLFVADTNIKIPAHNWIIGSTVAVESTIVKKSHLGLSLIYEPFEFPIFQKMISDAEAVFDVASNFGWYSYIARNAEKEVHSFEIIKEYYDYLSNVNSLNSLGIKCNHCAVSNDSSSPKYADVLVAGTAPNIVLDDYCEKNKVWPDAVKLDIEGWELEALDGAKELLSRRPKLQISIHDRFLKEKGSSEQEILKFLYNFGYSVKNKFSDCFWLE